MKKRNLVTKLEIIPQPQWDEGKEPDCIYNIDKGFVDGKGNAFSIPFRHAGFYATKNDNGVWEWVSEKSVLTEEDWRET